MTDSNLPTAEPAKKRKVHGGGLTAYGIYLLAESYHRAAESLREKPPRGAYSDNPIRFLYYHALEGYLRAFLRLHGKEPDQIRAFMHDFASMLEHCVAAGLSVRANTAAFVKETVLDSDYVRVRYEHELTVPYERNGPGVPGKELLRLVSATGELKSKMRDALIKTGIAIP